MSKPQNWDIHVDTERGMTTLATSALNAWMEDKAEAERERDEARQKLFDLMHQISVFLSVVNKVRIGQLEDRITMLEAENARLRETLTNIAHHARHLPPDQGARESLYAIYGHAQAILATPNPGASLLAERQAAAGLAEAVEAWRDAAPYDNGNHQEVYFDAMMDALADWRAASETNEQEK